MRNWLKDQQVLAIIVGGVAATIITAWVMNPQAGPAGWIKGLAPETQSFLSGAAILFVLEPALFSLLPIAASPAD
jgi:hypothetical protein